MDRWKRRPLPRGGKARQQKQHDKAQRRVAAKEQRASSAPRGSHGLRASFSAKQKEYRPGVDSVALSISPGMRPATFRMTSRTARPMTALAR